MIEISKRLDVSEMRMLRWSGAVTRHDQIRSELFRGTLGVKDPASSKAVERRLNLYGHIERQDGKHPLQKVEDLEVAGK